MAYTEAILNLLAMLVIAAITVVLVFGIRESVQVNNAVVFAKLLVVVGVSGGVLPPHSDRKLGPFSASRPGQAGVFGWTGVLVAC